jgi:50S ribosomal protein L16 3-hydroxylase
MKNALNALITPRTKPEFLKYYRDNTPMVSHGLSDSEEVSEILELPFLKSLEDLLQFWPKEVDCYLPGVADEVNSLTTSVEKAGELFKEGSGLIFNDADTESDVLRKWVEELIVELGVSSLTYGRSLIYAIPTGKVTDPHFDQNINFVLQLHGTKKWWIAPNHHVENPMTRHTIGTPMDPELASYSDEMPDSFPDSASEFTLKPGSFLFVPRGSWHTTKASEEDTLSISFTLTAPTWIDLLTAAMRGRLAQSIQWRETANFVSIDNKELFNEAADKFDLLLADLAHDIPNWQGEDILSVTEMKQHPDTWDT